MSDRPLYRSEAFAEDLLEPSREPQQPGLAAWILPLALLIVGLSLLGA